MSLSLPDLLAKLPNELTAKHPQAVIEAALAAERAQQATVARSAGARPAELDTALVARVRFNLETTEPADVAHVVRAGSASPEVRELEAKYSTRRSRAARLEAEAAPPRPARKRPAKKAAKKTAAKRAAKKTAPAKRAAAKQASPASTEGN